MVSELQSQQNWTSLKAALALPHSSQACSHPGPHDTDNFRLPEDSLVSENRTARAVQSDKNREQMDLAAPIQSKSVWRIFLFHLNFLYTLDFPA
jgi:hypothetical protein